MDRRGFLLGSFFALTSLNAFSEDKKQIVLTIDDGPRNLMSDVIDFVSENHAVFYIIGEQAKGKKFDLLKRAIEQGHVVGNHSYTHPSFSNLSFEKAKEEIERTREVISKAYEKTGVSEKLFFRFPYGDSGYYFSNSSGTHGSVEKKKRIRGFLKNLGYKIQFWDVDSEDWKHFSKKYYRSIDRILINCEKADNGDVVLTHENSVTTKKIIPFYLNQGYEFVVPS